MKSVYTVKVFKNCEPVMFDSCRKYTDKTTFRNEKKKKLFYELFLHILRGMK